jgi:hypothetical protein
MLCTAAEKGGSTSGKGHGKTNSLRAFLVGSISVSGPSGGRADGLLSAMALNRLRDSQRPHRLSGNIIPRGEIVSSGPAALS